MDDASKQHPGDANAPQPSPRDDAPAQGDSHAPVQSDSHAPAQGDPRTPSQGDSHGVVGAILADAKQERDERRVRSEAAQERVERKLAKKRSQARKLYYLAPVLVLMTVANLLMSNHAGGTISPDEEATAARVNLYMIAAAIEDYEQEHDRYPATLSQLGIEEPGIRYTYRGDSYSLSWETPAGIIEYEPRENVSPLVAAVAEMGGETSQP